MPLVAQVPYNDFPTRLYQGAGEEVTLSQPGYHQGVGEQVMLSQPGYLGFRDQLMLTQPGYLDVNSQVMHVQPNYRRKTQQLFRYSMYPVQIIKFG